MLPSEDWILDTHLIIVFKKSFTLEGKNVSPPHRTGIKRAWMAGISSICWLIRSRNLVTYAHPR